MALPAIPREELPEHLRSKPQADETIHHFGYIDAKGGCANLSPPCLEKETFDDQMCDMEPCVACEIQKDRSEERREAPCHSQG